MRKILSVVLSFCMLSIVLFATSITASAASGNWSSYTTTVSVGNIAISTPNQLAGFAANVNAGNTYSGYTVTLSGNINLSEHDWTAIGSSSHPFSGTFNGAGYTISGLSYSSGNVSNYGLFGYISGAALKNTSVSGTININDTSNIDSGESGVALLAGYIGNSSVVDNCNSSGSVTVSYKSASYIIYPNVAGIAGTAYTNSIIKNSKNAANINVTVEYNGSSWGTATTIRAGGIAGRANASAVTNCINSGIVSGTSTNIPGTAYAYSGGIAGLFESNTQYVTNCYSTGNIIANAANSSYSGGITGYNISSTGAQYCYWLSGTASHAYGSSTAAVANTSSFTVLGTLSTAVYSTTDLLTALNSWVTDNSARGGLFWTQSSSYPELLKTYTITYNTNGGTINDSPYPTTYTYGTDTTLPADLTLSDSTFAGWYDNAGFSGAAITQISATDIGNKTYYAKWTIASYTISGNVSGLANNSGVTVNYSGNISGNVTTNSSGNYTISNIPYGSNIAISVGDVQYYSTPTGIDLSNITANATGQNLAYTKNYTVTLSFVSASAIKDTTGTGILRFITKIGLSGDAPTVTSFGTYIVPLSLFTEGQYNNTANVCYDNSGGAYTINIKDGVTYSADLTTIPSAYSGTPIVAVSYVNLSNGDTVIIVLYTTSVDANLGQ